MEQKSNRFSSFSRLAIFITSLCLLLFSNVSALNFTLQEQQAVCSSVNLSFVECYGLWQAVDNYPVYEQFYNNYSNYNFSVNQTIYVNVTSNQTFNCSNQTIYINQTFDELTKIDEYKKRGFEPVFEAGFITNFKKVENCSFVASADSVLKSDCEVQKSEQYQRGRDAGCPTSSNSSSDFLSEYWYILLALLGLGVFAFFKFRNSFSSLFQKPQTFKPVDYSHLAEVPQVDTEKRGVTDEFA